MPASIIVIGAGPGGYMAAIRAAQLGARVTVAERAGLGGTCLHWGCIPTKSLRATADAAAAVRRASEYGVSAGDPVVDWAKAQARKASVVQTQAQGIARLFQAHGVELAQGQARLLGPGRVEVAGPDGARTLEADRVIVAAGSEPAGPPGLERDGQRILNSDDMLMLEALPASLAVVGAGVVGLEFAQLMADLGVAVTVIEALDRALPIANLDQAASKLIARELKKRRIALKTATVVTQAETGPDGVTLSLGPSPLVEGAAGQTGQLTVERVLLATGRRPASQALAEAGLALDRRGGVVVNERLETSLDGVYAVGDVLGPARPMLAHLAGHEGRAAAALALGQAARLSYDAVPAVAFTRPEAAWVGQTVEQARQAGVEAVEHGFDLRALGAAQARGELAGRLSLCVAQSDGRVLGGWVVGDHAGELVHMITLAVTRGLTARALAHTIYAHPTLSEAMGEAAEDALGLCLHAPPR